MAKQQGVDVVLLITVRSETRSHHCLLNLEIASFTLEHKSRAELKWDQCPVLPGTVQNHWKRLL